MRAHTNQEISGDQNPAGARAELFHDDVALLLLHIAVL